MAIERIFGRRRLAALLALATASCSDSQTFFGWPDALDLGFFIAVDGGTVSSINGPVYDGSAAISLPTKDEDKLFVVGWTSDELERGFPALDSDRLDETAVSTDSEECAEEGRLLQDRLHTRWPMPDFTRVFVLDRDTGDFTERPGDAASFENWSVDLPTGGPPCAVAPETRLKPFADNPRIFATTDLVGGVSVAEHMASTQWVFTFEDVLRLDDDRVLAASRSGLFLFDRTRPWTDSPSERVFFPEEGLPLADLARRSRFGVLPIPNTDRYRVVTFTGGAPGVEAGRGRVVEVELSPSGFGARQVSPELGGIMHSVAIDGRGRIVAVGGTTIYVGPTVDALTSYPNGPTDARGLQRDPDGDIWLVGLQAYVGRMDLDERPPLLTPIPIQGPDGPLVGARVSKLWFDDRGGERTIWASTRLFGRWAGRFSDGWRKVPVYSQPWPASNADCELGELVCGRTEIKDDIGLTRTSPTAIMDDQCPHLIVEYSQGCTAPVENDFVLGDDLAEGLHAIDDGAGWVTVAGADGLLLEMKL